MPTAKLRNLLVLTLGALLLSACATSPTGRSQLVLVSEKQAINMSKQAYVETLDKLEEDEKLVTDSPQLRRVRAITDRLVVQAKRMMPRTKDWAWEVNLIDEPETVNAWCMAGGKMAVYTGLINKLEPTDDELAQVMGHEISHALANHTSERMSVAMATTLGVTALSIAKDEQTAALGALAATLAIQLPNSRAGEAEADEIGIELAARAGYDPYAAVSLWRKMGELGGSRPPEFLSTHPSPENREERLRQLAAKVKPYYDEAKRRQ